MKIKPPLGIMPMEMWWEFNFDDPTSASRLKDIYDAIDRFTKAGEEIPAKWLLEKSLLDKIHRSCATTSKS